MSGVLKPRQTWYTLRLKTIIVGYDSPESLGELFNHRELYILDERLATAAGNGTILVWNVNLKKNSRQVNCGKRGKSLLI